MLFEIKISAFLLFQFTTKPLAGPCRKSTDDDVRAAPVLKGLHINPSGQSTLAFDKRIRQNKRHQQFEDVGEVGLQVRDSVTRLGNFSTMGLLFKALWRPFFLLGGHHLGYLVFGPVLLGLTDVEEDRLSSSWVC